MQNRSRRTAWLATRLQERSADEIQRLAAAAEVLERLVGPAATDRPVDRP
jgi:hypothetical protein